MVENFTGIMFAHTKFACVFLKGFFCYLHKDDRRMLLPRTSVVLPLEVQESIKKSLIVLSQEKNCVLLRLLFLGFYDNVLIKAKKVNYINKIKFASL